MIKHKDSHLDHALTEAQVAYILERFADKDAFFIETFELPEHLGTAPCGLYGPSTGDAPVPDADWHSCGQCGAEHFYLSGALCSNKTNANGGAYTKWRGDRKYFSRVVDRPTRPTRTVTVIGGGHDERVEEGTPGAVKKYLADATPVWVIPHPCILYTAFGGPLAPKEPGDLQAQVNAVKADTQMDDLLKARQLAQLEQKLVESTTFWSEHALSGV
jgi:hypothetical protein